MKDEDGILLIIAFVIIAVCMASTGFAVKTKYEGRISNQEFILIDKKVYSCVNIHEGLK